MTHCQSLKPKQAKQKCTICQHRYINSRLNNCNHKFCFPCINKWSNRKHTCPLCRQRFETIITKQKIRKDSHIIKQGRLRPAQNKNIIMQNTLDYSKGWGIFFLVPPFFFVPTTYLTTIQQTQTIQQQINNQTQQFQTVQQQQQNIESYHDQYEINQIQQQS